MSDIDNLRSKYSVPMSPMMRPKCAMEMSEPFDNPPVMPSVRADHLEPSRMAKLDSAVNRADTLSCQNDALQAALYQACKMLDDAGIETFPITLDTFRTESGPRVKMERIGNKYVIHPRPNTMGS